jgi:uncharacterized membrane protein YcaP (DUF421 family)
MQIYIEILCRTIAALFILLFIARFLGKQTISNMTFHDFVTGITLGAIAGNLAFNYKIQTKIFILSLIVITLVSYILTVFTMNSRLLRKWISGAPTVMIENGNILDKNMKKSRYTMDSLNQSLREKEIFNIEEVQYALLEDNGKLSVLKKDEYNHVTKKDLNIMSSKEFFPIELIMDANIMEHNLERNGLEKDWLMKELEKRGKRLSDVFYAVMGTRKQLVFDYYEDNIHHPVDKE